MKINLGKPVSQCRLNYHGLLNNIHDSVEASLESNLHAVLETELEDSIRADFREGLRDSLVDVLYDGYKPRESLSVVARYVLGAARKGDIHDD